eukprot:359328-Chlamydomonas_euryale.AAC.7
MSRRWIVSPRRHWMPNRKPPSTPPPRTHPSRSQARTRSQRSPSATRARRSTPSAFRRGRRAASACLVRPKPENQRGPNG